MEVNGIKGFLSGALPVNGQKGSDILEDFKSFILWVDSEQKKSSELKKRVLEGEDVPLHEIVLQAEKAKVALNLLIEVRNKLLEAYNELMKMQI
ncbi:flagellar hook-basal body complex protein FliE [Aquifex sp.]